MKQVVEIKGIEEFMVNLPIHKYVKSILNVNSATDGNTYLTMDLNTNTKKFYTIYFHCHGHAFEDQDKIRKLLKKVFNIGSNELKYEAPYELEYRLTPEKYNEMNTLLKMYGY